MGLTCKHGHEWTLENSYFDSRGCRYCRECNRLSRLRYNRSTRYGLTYGEYEEMRGRQGDKCAICATPLESKNRVHIDHDHETGRVRGVLCAHCNLGLGYLEHDDWLAGALTYLAEAK